MSVSWDEFDTWRSIWEAMAIRDGHPNGTGLKGHIKAYGLHPDDGDAAAAIAADLQPSVDKNGDGG